VRLTRLALTGGIATGKTYVLNRLRERGIAVIDSDDIVHRELAGSRNIAQTVAREFGSDVVLHDGSVDRARVAAKVFDDPAARRKLEAILHPVVYHVIEEWFHSLGERLGVASIPLLYETGHEKDFDAVIVTSCTAEQQLERLAARGLPRDAAEKRIAAQIPVDQKAARADFVIWTGGTTAETDAQIARVMEEIGGG
jgi:dephospho-CoA kinase